MVAAVGIHAKASNGSSRSFSYLYWGWIRKVVAEEGVVLPQSGFQTDKFSEREAKRLASALRARAEKIRKGAVPRDASSYIRQLDRRWFKAEQQKAGTMSADFDDPDTMDSTASFFDSSGGVTLRY